MASGKESAKAKRLAILAAQAKRLETLAEETERQQEVILEQLKKMPIVQTACAKAGIGHSTYYAWRKDDSEFAKAADAARALGKAFVNDMAESQLVRRIQEGHVTSIIYWLKNNHSDYTDTVRYIHEHEHHLEEISEKDAKEIAIALYNIGLQSVVRMNGAEEGIFKEHEAKLKEDVLKNRRVMINFEKDKSRAKKRTLGELLEEEADQEPEE